MMDNEENTDVNNMQGHTRPIQTIKPQINVFGNGGTKLNNFVSSQAPSQQRQPQLHQIILEMEQDDINDDCMQEDVDMCDGSY